MEFQPKGMFFVFVIFHWTTQWYSFFPQLLDVLLKLFLPAALPTGEVWLRGVTIQWPHVRTFAFSGSALGWQVHFI